jgi:uncharacterized protein
MQEIHMNIGLKFRVNDFITMMTESNYATYRYLLRKVNICDESTDEINTAYQNIIHQLDPFFEYEQFLERITNVPTKCFGNVNILNYDCVLDVKEIQFEQQSFHPRGNNIQTIPLDIMTQAVTEEISVVDGFDEPIDLSSLPPYEKVVSLFTELIE